MSIFAAGDKAVMRWTDRGTFENEFMGLPPTHEKGNPVAGLFGESSRLSRHRGRVRYAAPKVVGGDPSCPYSMPFGEIR